MNHPANRGSGGVPLPVARRIDDKSDRILATDIMVYSTGGNLPEEGWTNHRLSSGRKRPNNPDPNITVIFEGGNILFNDGHAEWRNTSDTNTRALSPLSPGSLCRGSRSLPAYYFHASGVCVECHLAALVGVAAGRARGGGQSGVAEDFEDPLGERPVHGAHDPDRTRPGARPPSPPRSACTEGFLWTFRITATVQWKFA